MPSKREINRMGPGEREVYEEEREARAARKRFRTNWRTDATETEKETALQVALNQIGGRKKYSWLETGPKTVAETLGQKRAIELGIRTGKLAEELKIGEHRDEHGPQSLVVSWEDLRSAGINMSKEEFEQSLRDAGTPEEEIRAALSPKAKKIVGRSAASVRKQPSPSPVEKAQAATSTKKTKALPKTPAKRGKKRAAEENGDIQNAGVAKKRKGTKNTTPKSMGHFVTPPASSSPAAYGSSPLSAAPLLDDRAIPLSLPSPAMSYCGRVSKHESAQQFAPSSPAISELEAILDNEAALHYVPTSPTVDELEALLEDEITSQSAPLSPTIDELEALLDDEITQSSPDTPEPNTLGNEPAPVFAPSSPTIDELEALLDDEITTSLSNISESETFLGNKTASESAPSSPDIDELEALFDDGTASLFGPSSPAVSELEALLDDGTCSQSAPPSPTIDELEALLDDETAAEFAPSSPAVSDLEALLDEEIASESSPPPSATFQDDDEPMSEED
ncbi:hypothetical protein GGR51DRAFT_571252 [Nemania sp. FL0031]|nr:hypothetical protein GGR51DRAFT_571252 [Nemania sp. FL0031]